MTARLLALGVVICAAGLALAACTAADDPVATTALGSVAPVAVSAPVAATGQRSTEAAPVPHMSTAFKFPTVYHHLYAVLYVESHAPNWPIAWAVRQLAGLDITVHYGPCRAYAGCARVYEVHAGQAANPGMTRFNADGSAIVEPVVTHLNDDATYLSEHMRQQVACHEVATDLGLMYRYRAASGLDSCLYWRVSDRAAVHISAADRSKINATY